MKLQYCISCQLALSVWTTSRQWLQFISSKRVLVTFDCFVYLRWLSLLQHRRVGRGSSLELQPEVKWIHNSIALEPRGSASLPNKHASKTVPKVSSHRPHFTCHMSAALCYFLFLIVPIPRISTTKTKSWYLYICTIVIVIHNPNY